MSTSTKKFYFHFDGKPTWTAVMKCNSSLLISVEDSLADFVDRFNAKFQQSETLLTPDNVTLQKNKSGAVCDGSTLISHVLEDGGDAFVTIKDENRVAKRAGTKKPLLEEKKSELSESIKKEIAADLKLAKKHDADEKVKLAKERLLHVLELDPNNYQALEHMGRLELRNEFFDGAVKYFEKAEQFVPGKKKRHLDVLIGRALFGAQDYELGAEYFKKALNQTKSAKKKQDVSAWMGRCYYQLGLEGQQRALQIFESIVQQNDNHGEALLNYSIIATDRGQAINSVPHLMKALVTTQQNPHSDKCYAKDLRLRIDRHFASIISMSGGPQGVLKELGDAASSPPAMAFIANVVKERGCFEEAAFLLEHVAKKTKSSSFTTLRLMHMYEGYLAFKKTFSSCVKYLESNNLQSIKTVYNRDVLKIINGVDIESDPIIKSDKIDWQPLEQEPIIPEDVRKAREDAMTDDSEEKLGPGYTPEDAKKSPYGEDELHLLGVYFTIIKILYSTGCLQTITQLIPLFEKLKNGYDLHLTTIRNEQAYYACVAQLMTLHTNKWCGSSEKPSSFEQVYVCGDSHCFSTAWQTMTLQGKPCILVPKLVTGLKCWHMRPKCDFFPAANFQNVLDSIPKGSRVIFMFGEIDCRESLLVCVNKGRYKTVEEGIQTVVDIYVNRLLEIQKRKKLQIFVHPVNPVLDVTRPVVMEFNKLLRRAVDSKKQLNWLDFENRLTTASGGFNFIYALDGTHMHPRYVPLIEEAMTKCL